MLNPLPIRYENSSQFSLNAFVKETKLKIKRGTREPRLFFSFSFLNIYMYFTSQKKGVGEKSTEKLPSITKTILETIGLPIDITRKNLEMFQVTIKEKIMEKFSLF